MKDNTSRIWVIEDMKTGEFVGIFTTKYRALKAIDLFLNNEEGVTIEPPIKQIPILTKDGQIFRVETDTGMHMLFVKTAVVDGGAQLMNYLG